jgi:hypothetical protein
MTMEMKIHPAAELFPLLPEAELEGAVGNRPGNTGSCQVVENMKGGKMEILQSIKKTCQAVKPDGSRCKAAALPGADFCFFHDPSKADERREAQSLGGRQNRMKTLDATVPDVKVEDCRDVVRLISETINQVRKGQIDPRVANAVGYLANVLIRAVDQAEMERRLAELEAILRTPRPFSDLAEIYQ